MKSVLVFGDSLTFGKGDDKYLGGWVGRLKSKIENREGYWCLYNLGIAGGEKIEDLLKRFNIEVEARDKKGWKDRELFLIFAIGVNDTRVVNGTPITNKRKFTKNLGKLIHLAKKYTKKIVFINILPIDEEKVRKTFGLKVFYNQIIDSYNEIITKTCRKIGVCSLNPLKKPKDFFLYKRTLTEDGLHPDSSGYELIADKINDFLKNTFFT